jgi:hypothetical protein
MLQIKKRRTDMYTKYGFKSLAIIALFTIPLIFNIASNGYAGGPQPLPEGFTLAKAKGIDGLLTAVVVDPDSDLASGLTVGEGQGSFVVQSIVLICKEQPVLYGPSVDFPSASPVNLADTTAECPGIDFLSEFCLEGWIFPEAAANLLGTDCFPNVQPGIGSPVDLVITRVRNFINTGDSINAEVTLRLGQGVSP